MVRRDRIQQAAADDLRAPHKLESDLFGTQAASCFFPEMQPAFEVMVREPWQLQVREHRIALVRARGQEHGRPESLHFVQMRAPIVADSAFENRAEEVIVADLAVKGVNHFGNAVFSYCVMHEEK
jgi:hypothetical protein